MGIFRDFIEADDYQAQMMANPAYAKYYQAWQTAPKEPVQQQQQSLGTQLQKRGQIQWRDFAANKNNPNWGGGLAQQEGFKLVKKNTPGYFGNKEQHVWLPPPGYTFAGGERVR